MMGEQRIPEPYDFKKANAAFRVEMRERLVREVREGIPFIAAANPKMAAEDVPYSAMHCVVMDLINELYTDDDGNCSIYCPSDVAWHIMYALGISEADANALATPTPEEPTDG